MSARLGAALLVVALLLGGCGGGDEEPAAVTSASPSAEPVWNPCDGIDVAPVQEALGEQVDVDRGTADSPRCALVPQAEGGAVLDANYLVFPEGLDAAWDQMGAPDDGSVTEPDIAGADAARLVASEGDEALGVTGFVQNGTLIQIVNIIDTPPYDRRAAVAAVRLVLRQLSAYAKEEGTPS